METDDEADEDFPELSTGCALTRHEDCLWGKCACDCHNEENAAMVEALRCSRASTSTGDKQQVTVLAEVIVCVCRDCKAEFLNPYSVGESYLCDACLVKPVDQKDIDRMRREP